MSFLLCLKVPSKTSLKKPVVPEEGKVALKTSRTVNAACDQDLLWLHITRQPAGFGQYSHLFLLGFPEKMEIFTNDLRGT